jgi:hypothetical protein
MRKSEPEPGWLSTSIRPLWVSAIHCAMDRPSPEPGISRERAWSLAAPIVFNSRPPEEPAHSPGRWVLEPRYLIHWL